MDTFQWQRVSTPISLNDVDANISFMCTGPAGKITVIKAGPGYMEEKHYDIGTDGNLVEITEQPPALLNDGCE